MIPYSKQSINDDDINEVLKVLKSEMITQGPVVERFEKTICSYTSSNYSVLTNSATSALHISLLSLGCKKGDEVLVPSLTPVMCANAIIFTGATPIFVDVDEETFLMDPKDLKKKNYKTK